MNGTAKRDDRSTEERGGGQSEKPTTAEWVVGIICGLIVLTTIGYLAYEALTGPELPPIITVRVERVVPTRAGYVIEFTAVNEGSGTAANVMIEGALMRDSVTVEKSTATLDFVPAQTEREGGLIFTEDPGEYRLELRATGYDRP